MDVVQVVGDILGTSFAQSVEWLVKNFPELNTKWRLQQLDKSKYFTKWKKL